MRIHDLRHPCASILASSGLSLPIIDAHTQPDDDRNAQSARCLTRLAENLKNLPDHHFQLLVVAALDIGIPGEIEPPEKHEWRMRPFRSAPSSGPFSTSLVDHGHSSRESNAWLGQ